jgi:membrane-associated phospholipid phosphatase
MNFSYRFLKAWWMPFLAGVLFFLIISAVFTKAEGFLFVQLSHCYACVIMNKWLTFIGDGVFTILVCVYLAFRISYRKAITLLTGYLIASLIVQLTKHVILPDMPRPVGWFEIQHLSLFIPDGLSPHRWGSFPSGHSATVAGLSLFVASIAKRRSVHVILACLAIFVGYSRIYLYMHFPIDVAIGLCIGAISMWYAGNLISTLFEKRKPKWAEKSILKK